MKILAITTTALLFAISAYAQITTITTKEKEVPVEVQKYDSLESLDYDNAPLHKGQTLFLKGSSYTKENGFYMDFFSKIIDGWDTDMYTYKPVSRTKDGEIVSSYSELAGKYYKVLSVESRKSDMEGLVYWFHLIGDDNIPFYFKLVKGY